tara:strand:- start:828 stop:998 length:171 start_codon:yes stop_codon:yes gene_type:complete
MSGAEIVAVISVSIAGLTSLLATCFHSRCSDIDCWGIKCKREVIKEPHEVIARPIV